MDFFREINDQNIMRGRRRRSFFTMKYWSESKMLGIKLKRRISAFIDKQNYQASPFLSGPIFRLYQVWYWIWKTAAWMLPRHDFENEILIWELNNLKQNVAEERSFNSKIKFTKLRPFNQMQLTSLIYQVLNAQSC